MKSTVITSVEKLAKLWVHENCRVYFDRLINEDDRQWLLNQIILIMQGTLRFDSNYDDMFKN